MNSTEIRRRFLKFFEERGHMVIPSASLVPENDPSVLFTTAGMQPLVPYLLGEKHPQGTRLVDFQKCVRTGDIEEVGDATHLTFFEMMGNWSLGDYFKKDAISWSYELLTSKEEGFGLDPKRLYVTVFEGNDDAPRDEESYEIWKSLGIPEHRIYFRPAEKNWWSVGDNGPCGADTEMFYDITPGGLGDLSLEQYMKADDEQKVVEIWNDVFMEFLKKDGIVVGKLAKKNVDTGSGFERVVMTLQGKDNVYDTDLFVPIMQKIEEFVPEDKQKNLRWKRIVADHIRSAVFLISDGVMPSNTDQGYILRRLIRRAVRFGDELGMKHGSLFWLADKTIETYREAYPNLETKKEEIKDAIDKEEQKFRKTLERGLKEFEKISQGASGDSISGEDAFILFSSYGFPIDLTKELAKEKKMTVDEEEFKKRFSEHQALSRVGAEQKFKGGLASTGVVETRYHTTTHLLNAALKIVLGPDVGQKGSNITAERLRFDFSHPSKMTDEEKKKVENLVNGWVAEALPVGFIELPKQEALATGAVHAFGDTYGDIVKIYRIGDQSHGFVSQEFCGGPHVSNTNELGHFKIVKEEAVSAGVRRIKAVLE
jgi:alanyl-tRNA synthetase